MDETELSLTELAELCASELTELCTSELSASELTAAELAELTLDGFEAPPPLLLPPPPQAVSTKGKTIKPIQYDLGSIIFSNASSVSYSLFGPSFWRH